MIESSLLKSELRSLLANLDAYCENSVIEFKSVPHSKSYPCEFYKDILAMLNSCDRPSEDRWIVYGVANDDHRLIGVDKTSRDLRDDADYQELISKIRPHAIMELVTIPAEELMGDKGGGKVFAALYCPKDNVGKVFELTAEVQDKEAKKPDACPKKYLPGTSFIRSGSRVCHLLEENRVQIRSLRSGGHGSLSDFDTFASLLEHPRLDPVRLLGSWDAANSEDRRVVSMLCEREYGDISEELRFDLSRGVFSVIGSKWEIGDRAALFSVIGNRITSVDLLRYRECFKSVLEHGRCPALPTDPQVPLNNQSDDNKCSRDLLIGIASLCACLANNRDKCSNLPSRDVDMFVSEIMSTVLCSDDWRVVDGADSFAGILAEASPSMYLSYIEKSLRTHDSIQRCLEQVEDSPSATFSEPGLITGVKVAASLEALFAKAMSVLMELGTFSSFATRAIVEILLPWHPCTNAPAASRKGVGKCLANSKNDSIWQAFVNLLPGKVSLGFPAAKAKFLRSAKSIEAPSVEEYRNVSREYCLYALEGARGDAKRIIDLASNIDCFRLSGTICEMADAVGRECSGWDDLQRYEIWRLVAEYVERCSRHAGAKWAPSEESLIRLSNLSRAIRPTGDYYDVLRAFSVDYVKWKKVYEDRNASCKDAGDTPYATLERLVQNEGVQVASRLISNGANAAILGGAFAHIGISLEGKDACLRMLNQEGKEQVEFAQSFALACFSDNGWDWIDQIDSDALTERGAAMLYSALPLSKETWQRAEAVLGDGADVFWRQASGRIDIDTNADACYCAERLLGVNRSDMATFVVCHAIENGIAVDADAVTKTVEASVLFAEGDAGYFVGQLVSYLERTSPSGSLWDLELRFPMLVKDRTDSLLFEEMSNSPALFSKAVFLACGMDRGGSNREGTLSGNTRLDIYFDILEEWKYPLGLDSDGRFSEEIFSDWLTKARRESRSLNCLKEADYQIGRNLFYSPADKEDFFIPMRVAAYLESNESARNGFRIESINSRGAHFVDYTGREEDLLAQEYNGKAAQAEEQGFVRLASLLRGISESFRFEAEENRARANS